MYLPLLKDILTIAINNNFIKLSPHPRGSALFGLLVTSNSLGLFLSPLLIILPISSLIKNVPG